MFTLNSERVEASYAGRRRSKPPSVASGSTVLSFQTTPEWEVWLETVTADKGTGLRASERKRMSRSSRSSRSANSGGLTPLTESSYETAARSAVGSPPQRNVPPGANAESSSSVYAVVSENSYMDSTEPVSPRKTSKAGTTSRHSGSTSRSSNTLAAPTRSPTSHASSSGTVVQVRESRQPASPTSRPATAATRLREKLRRELFKNRAPLSEGGSTVVPSDSISVAGDRRASAIVNQMSEVHSASSRRRVPPFESPHADH